MEQIKDFINVGYLYFGKNYEYIIYQVRSLKDLKIIIDHFNQYPLNTKKQADFELLKQVYYLMLRGEHLTQAGLRQILAIKASMNRGLSCELQTAFPDVVPVTRLKIINQKFSDPN